LGPDVVTQALAVSVHATIRKMATNPIRTHSVMKRLLQEKFLPPCPR
jgi:hypothetical protein